MNTELATGTCTSASNKIASHKDASSSTTTSITSTNITSPSSFPPSCPYYMPAEWQRHDACLIIYPHNTGVFRSERTKCDVARAEVRNVARAIQKRGGEHVFLFCNSAEEAMELEQQLREEEDEDPCPSCSCVNSEEEQEQEDDDSCRCRIVVKVCPSDDSWCRDTGPTFVFAKSMSMSMQGEKDEYTYTRLVGMDWEFNAYGGEDGGCYWPCDLDRNIAKTIISILNEYRNNNSSNSNTNTHSNPDTSTDTSHESNSIPKIQVLPSRSIEHHKVQNFILEGGSFHTDGEGTILTTTECLLHPNRNSHLTKHQIESILLQKLGAIKVIWLPDGIAFDDDTNGHVDNIATFARPGEVVLSWTDDEEDVNYERFRAAECVLMNEVDAMGRQIKIHRLHVPDPLFYTAKEVQTLQGSIVDAEACERREGERMAASYVNYYLANKAVVLPQFGDVKYDKLAIETMQKIFPQLEIVGVYSREILLGGGNIHCITQQVPMMS